MILYLVLPQLPNLFCELKLLEKFSALLFFLEVQMAAVGTRQHTEAEGEQDA
jgi:hypothetical protein